MHGGNYSTIETTEMIATHVTYVTDPNATKMLVAMGQILMPVLGAVLSQLYDNIHAKLNSNLSHLYLNIVTCN